MAGSPKSNSNLVLGSLSLLGAAAKKFMIRRISETYRGTPTPVVGFLYVENGDGRAGLARLVLQSVGGGAPDFLAALEQPCVLDTLRDKGVGPRVSPHYLDEGSGPLSLRPKSGRWR